MRLIDADELKSDILCRADDCCGVCNPYADSTVLEHVRTTLESVADSIDDLPTVDAVEVARSRERGKIMSIPISYCPFCGMKL